MCTLAPLKWCSFNEVYIGFRQETYLAYFSRQYGCGNFFCFGHHPDLKLLTRTLLVLLSEIGVWVHLCFHASSHSRGHIDVREMTAVLRTYTCVSGSCYLDISYFNTWIPPPKNGNTSCIKIDRVWNLKPRTWNAYKMRTYIRVLLIQQYTVIYFEVWIPGVWCSTCSHCAVQSINRLLIDY